MGIKLGDVFVAITANDDQLAQGLNSAKGKVTSWASNLQSNITGLVGGAVLGGVATLGAAVAGIGTAAFTAASDFDAATKKMQSNLGLTQQGAEQYRDVLENVFKNNFGDSIEDVAESLTAVEKAFGRIGGTGGADQLQEAAEAAIRLRDAFDVDINESTSAAVELMDKFGVSSEQAFDLLAYGFQQGLDGSGDFLDTITEYSTQFANGGATAEQFFSIIQSGMAGGALGTDKAADAFKEFRLRIQDGSKTTADGLALMGINADRLTKDLASGTITVADAFDLVLDSLRKIEDPTIRMQAGAAVIGTQFEDLGDSIVAGMAASWVSIEQVTSSLSKLNKQYETIPAFFEGLRRRALVAITPLGDAMLEAFNKALPSIEAWFTTVEGWIADFIANSKFEWTPSFRQVKLGDLFEFIQQPGLGLTRINIADYVDITWSSQGVEHIKLGDMFTFDAGEGMEFNIADYVTFIYDNRNQKVAIYIKDVFTLVSDEGGTFVNIADYLKLNFTPTGDKLNLADQFIVDFSKAGNITALKIEDVIDFTAGPNGQINIADYFVLDWSASGFTLLTIGDLVSFAIGPDMGSVNLAHYFSVDWTAAGIQQLSIVDLLSFASDGEGGGKINIADWFSLDWSSVGITQLTLGDLVNLQTDEKGNISIESPVWNDFINKLEWPTAIADFAWSAYVSVLSWPAAIALFAWETYVTALEWPGSIAEFAWDTFVSVLTWPLEAISSFAWSTFVDALSWPASIASFSWSKFITGVNLSALIPEFPGWSALLNNINPLNWGNDSPPSNSGSSGRSADAGRYADVGRLAMAGAGATTITNHNTVNVYTGDINNGQDAEALAYMIMKRIGGRG